MRSQHRIPTEQSLEPSGTLEGPKTRTGKLFGVVLALAFSALPAIAGVAPGQFIAKMYTEALGRIPDQTGWLFYVNGFANQGCSTYTLRQYGKTFFRSAEFHARGYGNAEKLLTLYRGALNREPDPTSFNDRVGRLNAGTTSWNSMVDEVFGLLEFSSKTSAVCSTSNPSYSFGNQAVWQVLSPTGSGYQGGLGSELQALLNAAPNGSTVWLAQHAVVYLTTTLDIPNNVTLATTGLPAPTHYASQARLVRASNFNGPLIVMRTRSKLKNVWVTGQRQVHGFKSNGPNFLIRGGTGSEISGARIENPAGASNVVAWGSADGYPCTSTTLANNLVTSYASSHYNALWADGFTIACENALVANNEVVDASDVAVVLFRSYPAVQRSIVRDNRILNAGNSSYGGLVFDGWTDDFTSDFTGAEIRNNLIWTGPYAHYDVALSVGTRPWFGNSVGMGVGAAMLNNSSGSSKINADLGIAVSGMFFAEVTGNSLDITHVNSSSCPTVDIAVASTSGWGSGNIQGPWVDTDVSNCVHH